VTGSRFAHPAAGHWKNRDSIDDLRNIRFVDFVLKLIERHDSKRRRELSDEREELDDDACALRTPDRLSLRRAIWAIPRSKSVD